ncbi:2-octaprenylphenol hydroxylase [Methylobacterium sp. ap11]|uniref:2-polyprenylphenol 6-hydroxylase n=1 Tax=Methylobacterium sp. ap11 TaxID=1761799 RepID=UPI0008B51069|nr:2-polyprenylphenol 6-hydroxylase [Methylobacterium sp. ap11]SEP45021.1 2-octaprenylphenol hydroxylase [Methylobacterium sp. ap11]
MLSLVAHLARGIHVGWVMAREGGLSFVDEAALPPHLRVVLRLGRKLERPGLGAGRLPAALTRLGPSYVKFGQFLATRPDIVGMAAARDLERLQDRVPPFPQEVAVGILESTLGKPVSELFTAFSEPIAAASIAQVHRAHLREPDGTERVIAVKIMRPGVRERFARDIQAMRFMARIVEALRPEAERLRPREVVETLARSVAMEMDLRLEAAALSELAENIKDDPEFRVPQPVWELTGRDVLASEWIDGIRLNDRAAIVEAGHDVAALGRTVIQSFLRHAIRDGFFHADMHPGNLFVDPAGRLVAVDFGIMGRLGLKERRFLAEILLGFILRDYRRVAEVHFEAGYVPSHHSVDDFAQAIRAIGEPIHQRRADEISMAKVLTLLFDVTALFDMSTRTELVMLQKTMVVVEGVARSLDPRLDMWTTAEPVVRAWLTRNLGPIGRADQARRAVLTLADVVADVPDLAQRVKRVLVRLDEEGLREVTRVERRIRVETKRMVWSTLALWVIAGSLLAIAVR